LNRDGNSREEGVIETGLIVVAAGYGSFRTEHGAPVPKVVERVRDIPMIAYPLRNGREIGITRTVVVVNPRDRGLVEQAIRYAIRIGAVLTMPEIVEQPTRSGSADAVFRAIPSLRRMGAEKALITYGDMPLWSARTFREVIDADAERVTVTMATVQRDGERFPALESYGRVARTPDKSIERIIEVDDPAITSHQRALFRVNPSLWVWDLRWLESAIPEVVPVQKTDGFGDERYMPPLVGRAVQEGRVVRELALSPTRSREALGVNTQSDLKRVQRYRI
jgi:bifunctional N-acetylglucosamine-1-phosphate-uridyltransferase/glucosamine-1-phosphate-acetyltransferase GlmU-like protein